ncbi:phage tail assembly chaperone [Hyphobacterium sp.]|uniref:phage tail assembly chaperone n=1 Tax=Hyphobacterium sp. TaxID=2004662 RepID=UPI003BACB8D2
MTGLPFRAWLRLAAERYGIAPHQFWALSLMEWLALTHSESPPALQRSALSNLLKAYPDKKNGH